MISSAFHKIHLQEKPWGLSALFPCRQPVFCPHPFYLFLIAKGEEELSKDLAQVPGRGSVLRVAGADTAGRRGEEWKGRAEQRLSTPLFPFQGESTHFSTPTFFPRFPNASCFLPALPCTHTYKDALPQTSSSDASRPQTPVTPCHSPTASH